MSNWYPQTPEAERLLAEETALIAAAELVAEALEARGMKRSALAERLCVGRSEVTQRLDGTRNLTVRSLAAMLHELDFELELSVRDRAHGVNNFTPAKS